MKNRHYLSVTVAAAATFALSSCDSRQEQARERALEKHADSLDANAEVQRAAGEANAENLERKAEAVRDQK